MTPEDLKREDEFLEAQAKAIRERGWQWKLRELEVEDRTFEMFLREATPEIIDA